MSSVVVLPAPLGPSRATTSPIGMARSTRSTATTVVGFPAASLVGNVRRRSVSSTARVFVFVMHPVC